MSKYEVQFFNKDENVKPKMFLGIPGNMTRGNLLIDLEWEDRKIVVPSSKYWLVIRLPHKIDNRIYFLKVVSRVDVNTKYRKNEREWIIEFPDSDSPYAEEPSDVNITIGPDEENEPPDPQP